MDGIKYVLYLVFGGVFVFLSLRDILRGLSSRGWPTTRGVVLASHAGGSLAGAGFVRRGRYGPKVTYRYTVEGREYISDVRSFAGAGGSSGSGGRRLAEAYPDGTEVTVHYHPGNPQLSVLLPGIGVIGFVPMAAGVWLLVLGAGNLLGVL